jgi:hypothetical protein
MKNPENVPLTKLDSKASLSEVITTLNQIIGAINSMWDQTENLEE